MAKPACELTDSTLLAWFGQRSLDLGREYFASGALSDCRSRDAALRGACQGTMPFAYRASASLIAGGIGEAECSCPVGAGGRCKHVAALLLAWRADPDSFREMPALETVLADRSRAELIALIERLLQLRPELEALLESALAEGPGSGQLPDPDVYRRQVAYAFRIEEGDWAHARRIAGDIGVTLKAGDDFLAVRHPAAASVVFCAVAATVIEYGEVFQTLLSDHRADLQQVFGECVEGLEACLKDGIDDEEIRRRCLQTLLGIFAFDLDCGGIELGGGVEDVILEHATGPERAALAAAVRAKMPEGTSWSTGWIREAFGGLLLDLERDVLDDSQFLRICRETGRINDLVDRLLMRKRFDEAVAEAGNAEDYDLLSLIRVFARHDCVDLVEPVVAGRDPEVRDTRLTQWLKSRHLERGDLEPALELAGQLLGRGPDLDAYRELRRIARRFGNWPQTRSRTLSALADDGRDGLLTDIYLDEGEIEKALDSVRRINRPVWQSASRLIRVAEAASASHGRAAIEIYRDLAERWIGVRGRNNYRQACSLLVRVRDLYRKSDQEDAWAEFIADLKDRNRRLRALQEELRSAGLSAGA